MEKKLNQAFKKAEDYGIDINLLLHNLSLSPMERIDQHQRSLDIINELRRNFKQTHGTPKKPPSNPSGF